MEKFGIFELLDTLSAITAAEGSTNPAKEETLGAPETQESRRPDAAFAPPSYAGGQASPPPSAQADALGAFYARHERAKGKVKK